MGCLIRRITAGWVGGTPGFTGLLGREVCRPRFSLEKVIHPWDKLHGRGNRPRQVNFTCPWAELHGGSNGAPANCSATSPSASSREVRCLPELSDVGEQPEEKWNRGTLGGCQCLVDAVDALLGRRRSSRWGSREGRLSRLTVVSKYLEGGDRWAPMPGVEAGGSGLRCGGKEGGVVAAPLSREQVRRATAKWHWRKPKGERGDGGSWWVVPRVSPAVAGGSRSRRCGAVLCGEGRRRKS